MIDDRIYTKEDVLAFMSSYYSNIRRLWLETRHTIIRFLRHALLARNKVVNEAEQVSFGKTINVMSMLDVVLEGFVSRSEQERIGFYSKAVSRIQSSAFRSAIKQELERNKIYIDKELKNTKELVTEVLKQRYDTPKDIVDKVARMLRYDRDVLIEKFNEDMFDLLEKLNAGKINIEDFRRFFENRLRNHFVGMFKAGKGKDVISEDDKRYIDDQFKTQIPYIDRFVNDIMVKLQAGQEIGNREKWRLGLYGNRAGALYEAGVLSNFDPNDKINWVLGIAEHCPDCISISQKSPYSRYTLPCMPGDGTTACKANCQCHLDISKEHLATILDRQPDNQSVYVPKTKGDFYTKEKLKFVGDEVKYIVVYDSPEPILFRSGKFANKNIYWNGKTNKTKYLEEALRRIPKQDLATFNDFYISDAFIENGEAIMIYRDDIYISNSVLNTDESVGYLIAKIQQIAIKKKYKIQKIDDKSIMSNKILSDYIKARNKDLLVSDTKKIIDVDLVADLYNEMSVNFSEYLLTGQITDTTGAVMENLTKWANMHLDFSGEITHKYVFGKDARSKFCKDILKRTLPSEFKLKHKRPTTALQVRENIYGILQDYYYITDVERKRITELKEKIIKGTATKQDKKVFEQIETLLSSTKIKMLDEIYKMLAVENTKKYDSYYEKFMKLNITAKNIDKDEVKAEILRALKLVDKALILWDTINVYVSKDIRRSWYANNNLYINSGYNWKNDLYHELGHWIDYNFKPYFSLSVKDFYKQRTKHDVMERLSDITGLNYLRDEYTKKDKFVNPYMGKVYKSGSTELVSMVLQMFASGDVAELAINDPEMFDFFFNLFRGTVRQ